MPDGKPEEEIPKSKLTLPTIRDLRRTAIGVGAIGIGLSIGIGGAVFVAKIIGYFVGLL